MTIRDFKTEYRVVWIFNLSFCRAQFTAVSVLNIHFTVVSSIHNVHAKY